MAPKKRPVVITLTEALGSRLWLLDTATHRERSGTLGTFRLADLIETLEASIGRLQDERTRIQELAKRPGKNRLIAELWLTDGEASEILRIALTAHHSIAQDVSVTTPGR